VVNVPGVPAGKLRLSPDVLANIFLGTVKKWNDPAIASLNPGLALPNRAIAVVHRSDGSGTTWIFTNYLDKVSPAWHAKVGTEKAVPWPTGIGGKGNEGVAAYVQRIQGAIGYVEFAYAIENKMTTVMLKNAAGSFVAPSIESFRAAAASADWKNAPGFRMVLTNQPGAGSWPITGASFIIVQKQQKNPKTARDMLAFFDWCYTHGGDIAKSLAYVPVPEPVAQLVRAQWAKEVSAGGKPAWTVK
jgi:phosphate transport system substrate-binding protein